MERGPFFKENGPKLPRNHDPKITTDSKKNRALSGRGPPGTTPKGIETRDEGLELLDVVVGPLGVLTGSGRTRYLAEQEAASLGDATSGAGVGVGVGSAQDG